MHIHTLNEHTKAHKDRFMLPPYNIDEPDAIKMSTSDQTGYLGHDGPESGVRVP